MITAIVTCMGRREHLEMSLPLMLNEFERVIVVDWSCPQDSGRWAKKQGAHVVFYPGERYFNVSRARNLGMLACETRNVCFADADTLVMPGIQEELESLIDAKSMVIAPRTLADKDFPSLYGFLGVDSEAFWAVGGYPRHFEGYGMEDQFMRAQLKLELGLKVCRVRPELLASIRHTNELRTRHYRDTLEASNSRNYDYLASYLKSKHINNWVLDPRTSEIAYQAPPNE